MRVISGMLKGRPIKIPSIIGTRPTMDRVKESFFAMIASKVKESICLDLFAGSGSLGFEAISNGSKKVYFVDNNKFAIKAIKDNASNFKIEDKVVIILNDYKKALAKFKEDNIKFDLIFLDPPYKEELIDNILENIVSSELLNKNGQVVCEFMDEKLKDNYGDLKCIKEKKYGNKKVKIYNL